MHSNKCTVAFHIDAPTENKINLVFAKKKRVEKSEILSFTSSIVEIIPNN